MILKKCLLIILLLFTLSSCSKSTLVFYNETSYINYNNYNMDNGCMDVQDNTLYLSKEGFYSNDIYSINSDGKKSICSNVSNKFVKFNDSVYYTDDEWNLKKKDINTGKLITIFENVTNDLYLIYDNNIIIYNKGKLLLYNEDGSNEELFEKSIFWIGANQDGIYAVSYDESVFFIDTITKEVTQIGTFPDSNDYTFILSNNYLVGYSNSTFKEIVTFNLFSSELKTYQTIHPINAINANRHDIVYYMCCAEGAFDIIESEHNGLYRLDLKTGEEKLIDDHVYSVAGIYIFDDDWVYTLGYKTSLIFGYQEIYRVSVNGNKREYVYKI